MRLVVMNAVIGSAYGGMGAMYKRYGTVLSELGFEALNVGVGRSGVRLEFYVTIPNSGHYSFYAPFCARRLVAKHRVIAAFCHFSRFVVSFCGKT